MKALCLCLLWLLLGCDKPLRAGELRIASFNVRILSTGSRDGAELEQIADRLQQFEVLAIQEVRDEEVIGRLLAILEGRGLPYRALISAAVGRTSATERYAFLWRADKVELIGTDSFYPDSADVFIREPFMASFRAGEFDFALVTIHTIFGNMIGQRRAEAGYLDEVYAWAQEADPDEQDVILLGDFNLPAEDPGFDELRLILLPLFSGQDQTTIADNALDNIWIEVRHTIEWNGEVGIDRFDETIFGGDDQAASLAVSDHRPIWAMFSVDGPDDDGFGEPTAAEGVSWGGIKAGVGR